jgi:hypothetical protein
MLVARQRLLAAHKVGWLLPCAPCGVGLRVDPPGRSSCAAPRAQRVLRSCGRGARPNLQVLELPRHLVAWSAVAGLLAGVWLTRPRGPTGPGSVNRTRRSRARLGGKRALGRPLTWKPCLLYCWRSAAAACHPGHPRWPDHSWMLLRELARARHRPRPRTCWPQLAAELRACPEPLPAWRSRPSSLWPWEGGSS